ncbi:hypothetical protein EB001_13840 [bacterium]|nr:hypothetical protein [bacterium]
MDKLAVILPSRGLMFSETLEELLNELEGFNYEIFWSHEKSLPDCFNSPTEKILKDKSVYAVLVCEDDMIIPKGILRNMFKQNYPVVALDYPFKNNGDSTVLNDPNGYAYWTGTGFLLIAKPILEAMPKPIWRTDIAWDTMIKGNTLVFWPRKLTKVAYGLHDVNFGMVLYSQGIPIKMMAKTAGQRKLVALGEAKVNEGKHDIKELTKVGRDMVIKNMEPEAIEIFKRGLKRVTALQILDAIPDYIYYVDGQAHYKGRDDAEYV